MRIMPKFLKRRKLTYLKIKRMRMLLELAKKERERMPKKMLVLHFLMQKMPACPKRKE
jgi:hypothetical protein